MNRILGNIYISDINGLNDDMDHVTNVLSILPGELPNLARFNHLQIDLLDDNNLVLFPHLPQSFKFINLAVFETEVPNIKTNHKGHLLIHCHEGLNRSVCILVCYLIKYYGLSLHQAIYAIKRKQPIQISDWFMRQLRLFEEVKGELSNLKIRQFLIDNMPNGYDIFQKLLNELQQGNTDSETANQEILITCKKCRTPLAKSSQLLTHSPPDMSSHQIYFKNQLAHNSCTHYFLKDPLKWMGLNKDEESGPIEGKLNCPGCTSKIGGFSWKGSRCSCGRWITPSFNLLISKVESRNQHALDLSSQTSVY